MNHHITEYIAPANPKSIIINTISMQNLLGFLYFLNKSKLLN